MLLGAYTYRLSNSCVATVPSSSTTCTATIRSPQAWGRTHLIIRPVRLESPCSEISIVSKSILPPSVRSFPLFLPCSGRLYDRGITVVWTYIKMRLSTNRHVIDAYKIVKYDFHSALSPLRFVVATYYYKFICSIINVLFGSKYAERRSTDGWFCSQSISYYFVITYYYRVQYYIIMTCRLILWCDDH